MRMTSIGVVGAVVAGVLIAGQPDVYALTDSAAPTVTGYAVVPTTVDVTHQSTSATIVLRIRDTDGAGQPGSGFDHGSVTLSNGTQPLSPVAFTTFNRVSGSATDGTYDVTVPLAQGTPGGAYTATDIALSDVFGNPASHTTNSKTLTVTRTPDTTAPALVGPIAVSGSTATVTKASVTILYTLTLTDAVSGVDQVSLDLTGPDDGFGTPLTDTLYFGAATGTVNNGTWTAQKTFFPTDRAGLWTPTALHLRDGYGNATTLNSLSGGVVTVSKTDDSSPPTVSSVGVAPTSVNTTDAEQTITVSVAASDALSGVASGSVGFTSPDQQSFVSSGFPDAPTSGTVNNGVWTFPVTVPLRSTAGTWTLDSLSVQDAQGQSLDLATGNPGLPVASFSVTTTPDTTGPVLTQFTLGPSTVTAAYGGGAQVGGAVGFTDDVSGLQSGTITFRDPNNTVSQRVSASLFLDTYGPGTGRSGTIPYSVFVENLPADIGTWTVDKVELVDRAGVVTAYSTVQLSSAGFPTTFDVTATATDTQAPTLTSLAIAPSSVSTTAGDQTVTVTAGITDPDAAPSGFSFGEVTLQSPSHAKTVSEFFGVNATGTIFSGTWTAQLIMPKYSENGIWTVSRVDLFDVAGHERVLLGGDLASAQLTTTLSVTAPVDTTLPNLTGVTLDTPSVNTATTTIVSFHLSGTDNASGVSALSVTLAGPGGRTRSGSGGPASPSLSANVPVGVDIPLYNSAGTWTTSSVTVTDLVGNQHVYGATDLTSLGLNRSVTVTSVADTTAPAESGLTLTPAPVDTTDGPVDVDVLVHLTDAVSGVSSASLAITSPHGSQTRLAQLYRIAGSSNDGWYQGTWALPKYVDPGTWVVGPLVATDSEGNTLTLSSAQLAAASQPASLAVSGPPDPNAPSLTSLVISPASSPNSTAHPITFSVTGSDAESGLASATLEVTGPGAAFPDSVGLSPQSPNGTSVTFQGTLPLPAFAAPGTWTVSSLVLTDGYGNQRTFTHAQLVTAGVANSSFTITGTADTAAPTLTGLTLSSNTTDVSGGATTVNGTVTATDNQSGVSDVEIEFQSPSGTRHVNDFVYTTARTSGTAANPTIPFSLQMPQYAQAGDWTLSRVTTTDSLGNTQSYPPVPLPTSGVATLIHVVDTNPDLIAPTLPGVSAPASLDVHAAPANLPVDVHLKDAASGIASGDVVLTSPSGQDVRTQAFDAANRTSGSLGDGTYRVTFAFGTATESGSWSVTVHATDIAGNPATFTGATITGSAHITITGAPSKPGAPSTVTAAGGNQKATVGWSTPPNGGAAITGYVVTPSKNGVVQAPINVGLVNQTMVLGLTNGASYTFTVAAKNSVGTGTASAPSNSVTPAPIAPAAPAITGATAGDTTVSLTWTAPSDTGGSPITGYDVTVYNAAFDPLSVQHLGTGLSKTVIGLTNGVAYQFGVRAVNEIGAGTEAFAGPVTPVSASATVPGAPAITTAALSQGGTGVVLGWTAPASDGGSPITGYVVTPYVDSAAQTALVQDLGAVTDTTVTNLTKGVTYTFKVAAKNAVGTGTQSAPSGSVTIPPTVSGAPTAVTAVAGSGQATVRWTAPADSGGSPITQYVVTPVEAGVAQAPVTLGAVLSTTITGLTNGVSYTFLVHAVNAVGNGPDATSGAVVPRLPTKLVITSAPTLATYNVAIRVVGKLTRADTNAALAGQTVRLQYRRKGSTAAFSTFATSKVTSSTGAVTFTTFRPLYPVDLRLSFATAGGLRGSTSTSRIVACQMAVSLTASATSTVAGRTVTFSGSVAPRHAGKTVYLQRLSGTTWTTVTSKALSSTSTYAFALRLATRGTFKYRARMAADATFSSSVSVVRTVVVS